LDELDAASMTAKRNVDIVSPDAGVSALAPTLVSDQAQPVTVRAGRTLQIALAEGAARAETTVFLVHGAGGNQNQWRAVWQALVAQGFRVVAFDLLGHGTSPKPRDRAAYRGSAMAEDVRAVFERYAGDPKAGARNVVVAHSYGVRLTLAALLALRDAGRPEVFAKAVLLGAQAPDAGFASGGLQLAVWAWDLATEGAQAVGVIALGADHLTAQFGLQHGADQRFLPVLGQKRRSAVCIQLGHEVSPAPTPVLKPSNDTYGACMRITAS